MTMTTALPDFTTACPSWCTGADRENHAIGNEEIATGRFVRDHEGPTFGPHLYGFADEYADAPGRLHFGVHVYVEPYDDAAVNVTDPARLLDLAANAAAAQWLEAHR